MIVLQSVSECEDIYIRKDKNHSQRNHHARTNRFATNNVLLVLNLRKRFR